LKCKLEGTPKTIAFALSGHGHFDMGAYTSYFAGSLGNTTFHEADMKEAIDALPQI
jgi:tryptophan synthase beta chain